MSIDKQRPLDNSIAELYLNHSQWLRDWLNGKTGCYLQAEDLTHDTFVKLFKNQQTIETPRAFLLTIAKRVLFNFWRRRDLEQAYLQALSELEWEYAPSAEEIAEIHQAIAELDQVLNGLPILVKQAFLLSKLDGKSYPQIALEIGKSLATVERYMKQAYLHCFQYQQRQLQECGDDS